jgi:hypothetical protein
MSLSGPQPRWFSKTPIFNRQKGVSLPPATTTPQAQQQTISNWVHAAKAP